MRHLLHHARRRLPEMPCAGLHQTPQTQHVHPVHLKPIANCSKKEAQITFSKAYTMMKLASIVRRNRGFWSDAAPTEAMHRADIPYQQKNPSKKRRSSRIMTLNRKKSIATAIIIQNEGNLLVSPISGRHNLFQEPKGVRLNFLHSEFSRQLQTAKTTKKPTGILDG